MLYLGLLQQVSRASQQGRKTGLNYKQETPRGAEPTLTYLRGSQLEAGHVRRYQRWVAL